MKQKMLKPRNLVLPFILPENEDPPDGCPEFAVIRVTPKMIKEYRKECNLFRKFASVDPEMDIKDSLLNSCGREVQFGDLVDEAQADAVAAEHLSCPLNCHEVWVDEKVRLEPDAWPKDKKYVMLSLDDEEVVFSWCFEHEKGKFRLTGPPVTVKSLECGLRGRRNKKHNNYSKWR